jgi:hypothetical protein
MQELSIKIGYLNSIGIADPDPPYPGNGEIQGDGAPKAAGPGDKNPAAS